MQNAAPPSRRLSCSRVRFCREFYNILWLDERHLEVPLQTLCAVHAAMAARGCS